MRLLRRRWLQILLIGLVPLFLVLGVGFLSLLVALVGLALLIRRVREAGEEAEAIG
jgi:hypothetical protein